jgi:hypothetical protein
MAVIAASVPLGLAACSSAGDAQALAAQACVHVHHSVTDWLDSLHAGTSATTSADLQRQAEQQLRVALPLAAAANSDDGSWNSLMTTISEIGSVDEGHLLPALTAQCVLANSNSNVNPQNPGGNTGNGGTGRTNTPPTGNVNPQPASG